MVQPNWGKFEWPIIPSETALAFIDHSESLAYDATI